MACNHGSSSFRDPSQRRLFGSVYIDLETYGDLARRNAPLLGILSTNPRIASFVKIGTLRRGSTTRSLVPWKNLPDHFKVDLLHLLNSPTLRELSLGEVDFSVEYLHSVPSPSMPSVTLRETHLAALSITTHLPVWDKLPAVLRGEGTSPRPGMYLTRQLTVYSRLATCGTQRPLPKHLYRADLSNLQHLRIGLDDLMNVEDALFRTFGVLKMIPYINSIVSIVIKVNLKPGLVWTVWSDIDELLTSQHFVTLRRLVVDMGQRTEHPGLSTFARLPAQGLSYNRSAPMDRAEWQSCYREICTFEMVFEAVRSMRQLSASSSAVRRPTFPGSLIPKKTFSYDAQAVLRIYDKDFSCRKLKKKAQPIDLETKGGPEAVLRTGRTAGESSSWCQPRFCCLDRLSPIFVQCLFS
ncbi:hypothetical protein LshimejAT787_0903890 [Lyophyllum shimeji]|uniref:Glycosyltransferase family 92 protein n=1 Tax=Lyophyllum shimeji TaxID=47721 RepID=A0A9P3PTD3_LYOSH|nr:hypothetical protein LshimejAT787_0903890 [Lyophyllum shimeji]